jgi:flagellar biosynthesis anti-sigma factor FlgM
MRISRDVESGLAQVEGAGGRGGGWFQVAETMGRARGDDSARTGRRRPEPVQRSGISRAMVEAMDFSDVRLEKVMQLRAAIAEGRYRVSGADVADRMLSRLMGGGMAQGES